MFSNVIISLILGAGAGAFTYSKLGKRIGYGNTKRLWLTIAIVFAIFFILILLTLSNLPVKKS